MMCRIHRDLRGALVALLALALVAVGFAHRAPSLQQTALAAYLSAGGTLGNLCVASDPAAPEASRGDCPACHLSATAALPEVAMLARPAGLRLLAEVTAPRASRAPQAVLDHARASRAPPQA